MFIRYAMEVQRTLERIPKVADLSHIMERARETERLLKMRRSVERSIQPALEMHRSMVETQRSIERLAKRSDAFLTLL